MNALERFNQTATELKSAKESASSIHFFWDKDAYEASTDLIAELESQLKVDWLRLQIELGMEISIASIMA